MSRLIALMPRWITVALWSAALGTIGFLFVETARVAAIAGRHEIEAREARAVAAAAVAKAAAATTGGASAAPAAPTVDAVAWANLQLELQTCRSQLEAVTALLEQRNAKDEKRAAEVAAAAPPPIPEGVRLCLTDLHACLRAEGFGTQRFLSASSLDEDGLHDVEMLDAAADGLGTALVSCKRMTAILDRAAGRLDLRFFDGNRATNGSREALPKDGLLMSFRDIDGRMFEAKLPALVHGEGSYPDQRPSGARPPTDVDPMTRREWLARFERVLEQSGVTPAWRVTRFRGMKDRWFLGGEFVASDEHHHVAGGAHCESFAIEVDASTGVVSLLLRDGTLRRGVLESSITGEGYRILLPKLTCKQATDVMFGMVVTK